MDIMCEWMPRHSTIVGCDKIFVVNQGKVAEHGTHQELLEKEGIYAAMYERQDGKMSDS